MVLVQFLGCMEYKGPREPEQSQGCMEYMELMTEQERFREQKRLMTERERFRGYMEHMELMMELGRFRERKRQTTEPERCLELKMGWYLELIQSVERSLLRGSCR